LKGQYLTERTTIESERNLPKMKAGPHTKQADIAAAKQADARVNKCMHVCFWAWLHQLAGRVRSGCSGITIIIALNSALAMGQAAAQVIERTFV
jgi:hypothetical protein